MSTHLNITSNLFGLSNALGLEKQATQLLRNSIKHFNPGSSTIRSMQKIVAKAPRARSGALSPTKMVDYIANNASELPGFAGVFGSTMPASERFAALAKSKAIAARDMASNAATRYSGRIRSGEVDALDPATLKRLSQLQNRESLLTDAIWDIDENLAALKGSNPFYHYS